MGDLASSGLAPNSARASRSVVGSEVRSTWEGDQGRSFQEFERGLVALDEREEGADPALGDPVVGQVCQERKRAIALSEQTNQERRCRDRLACIRVDDEARQERRHVLNHHDPWLHLLGDIGDHLHEEIPIVTTPGVGVALVAPAAPRRTHPLAWGARRQQGWLC